MKKLFLKIENKIYCYDDGKDYLLKETTGGRCFVWIHRYGQKDKEADLFGHGLDYNDYEDGDAWRAALNKHRNKVEKNRDKGYCIELAKWSYEDLLKRAKESEKHLEANKQHLEPDGSNPKGVQIYEETPEENARKYYEKKDNKFPYGWGSLMGRWGSQSSWYIPQMLEKSDHFFDENKKEIKYDRVFFDSIQQNVSAANKALRVLKSLIEEKCKNMKLYEEWENCTNSLEIQKYTNRLKLEFYFGENARRMDKEIRALIPRGRGKITEDINYRITYSTDRKGIDLSIYSHLK